MSGIKSQAKINGRKITHPWELKDRKAPTYRKNGIRNFRNLSRIKIKLSKFKRISWLF
jgi:hypothetical protein